MKHFIGWLFVGFVLTGVSLSQTHGAELREYRDRAMNGEGDLTRGKQLFFEENKCGCARCHTIDGSAGKVGPDLLTAGDKFPRRELIRAILEPSSEIAIGYGTTIIETKSNDEFSGVIKQVSDEWTELTLADGRKVRIKASEIREQRGSNISLMPEGLHSGISAREFTDLVEYVASLKERQTAQSMNRGTPAEIPELARPVRLVPFFSEELRFPHAFVHKPGDVRSGLVWFGQLPGNPSTFVAVHQTGKIWLLEKRDAGDTKTLFADVATQLFNERGPNGLLSIAFHPKFLQNRKYYLKHQVFEDGKIATVLTEREAATDLKRDSGKRSRRLLKIVSTTQDHSGGCIEFGPDGYLYLGMGDTGPQQDPQGHGQDMQLLLSKIIRIDVDGRDAGLEYAIPVDNPFRNRNDARPEIWALGFREPWRFSFDTATGDLWVGDVGQDRVEEVAIVRRGENHGWNVYEGFEPFSNLYRRDGEQYIKPVFAYRRKYGNSITGGYVYRGDKTSSFYGVYICGDYTSKRIWGLTQENRVLKTVREIAVSPQFIASFGTDEAGNIYVVGYEGMVYKIDFSGANF
ncbi:MAG TPA: PQQ-dependent sugar dehydrogenase [Verrucomicrobiae bacterium]|nr:PQQ-dependent sugar dehydrogenase [Verrucomicrobiae bacterium]